nr:MAG TPA: hypothetical protein [Caudoviricetes sp.]
MTIRGCTDVMPPCSATALNWMPATASTRNSVKSWKPHSGV